MSLLFLLLLAVLTSACTPEDPFMPTRVVDTTIKHPAYLRIVHAAAAAPAAFAVLGDKPFHGPPALPYLTYQAGVNAAQYYPADTSWHSIGFLGDGSMLATAPITMEAGAFYTAYLYGRSAPWRILVTRDTVEPPASVQQIRVRVANLVPDAPAIDIYFTTSPNAPVVRNLPFGSASAYSLRGPADLDKAGIVVIESASGDTLMAYPAGITSLFGHATMTLVVSGAARPSGPEPMLSFAAFIESYTDPETGLYGLTPLRLSLTAIRLINLVPTSEFERFDLAFYDAQFEHDWPGYNDGYRRNYPGQAEVKKVLSLVYPNHEPKGYFLQSSSKSGWRYRVERSILDESSPNDQPVVSGPDSLTTQANKRYTVVVFGPNVDLQAGTAELSDNVELPTAGQARLRFFHGAPGTLQGRTLRLRVGGAQSALQAYGQAPTSQMTFDVPAGTVTLEVVDDTGAVVASSEQALLGGIAYTVFLAPLADGSGWIIRPVADQL